VSAAVRFLYSFTRALATMALYGEGHPARERSIEMSFERLQQLLAEDPRPQLSFLAHEVILGQQSLRELQDWEWARRLADAGLQRLEIDGTVTLEDYGAFLDDVYLRLGGGAASSSALRPARPAMIKFGAVGVRDEARQRQKSSTALQGLSYTLTEEADAVRWIHDEVQERGSLPLLEAEAVVRSLSIAMHGDSQIVVPLLQLKRFDQYTTTHSINVAVLAMAVAESLGFGGEDVRAFGTAGLLHDLGKVNVPPEILIKPGHLTAEERAVLNRHPIDGARLILASDKQLGLAAAVAYEHHIMIDGGGYPQLRFPRDCHYASRLVHVCDVFDALRTNRPYRAAWPLERAVGYIEERLGTEFDPEIARTFVGMMWQMQARVLAVEEDAPVVAAPAAAPA